MKDIRTKEEERCRDALKELELYVQELRGDFKWYAEKENEKRRKKRAHAQKVPNRDASLDGSGRIQGAEVFQEDIGGEKGKEGIPGTGLRGPVPAGKVGRARPFLHLREYEQAVPFLSLESAEIAVSAVRDLIHLRSSLPAFLVMYIDDDGQRKVTGAKTFLEAKIYAEQCLQEAIDALEEGGRMQEVYIDDGTGGPYPPTPPEFINDDGSHKCEADALGKLHIFRGEMHYIIYNELAGKTSRWDIFPMDGVISQESANKEVSDAEG